MIDRARTSLAVSLLSLVGLVGQAAAQPAPVNARVVWVRDERVYIASPDSLALGYGTLLTFVSRGQPVATGEVERVVDGALAVARLTSGSLARVKDLKRLRILSEPARGPRSLRVGYPSRHRSTLFFACDHLTLAPPFPPGSYRMEVSDHLYRLIPATWARSRVPWPETLVVRLFDEAADEEIALERGEVDVGVFWPGELSTHMREQPRWQDHLSSPKPRGLVAALRLGPAAGDDASSTTLPDGPLFTALNQELFRGELDERWHGRESDSDPPAGSTTPHGARYEVDPACPGRPVLERFLARAQGSPRATDDGPVIRLFHLDSPLYPPDSIALAAADYVRSGPFPPPLRARADTVMAAIRSGPGSGSLDPGGPIDLVRDALRVDLLFAFDCPVLFDPRLRPYVSALGAKAFVDLFECTVTGRRP